MLVGAGVVRSGAWRGDGQREGLPGTRGMGCRRRGEGWAGLACRRRARRGEGGDGLPGQPIPLCQASIHTVSAGLAAEKTGAGRRGAGLMGAGGEAGSGRQLGIGAAERRDKREDCAVVEQQLPVVRLVLAEAHQHLSGERGAPDARNVARGFNDGGASRWQHDSIADGGSGVDDGGLGGNGEGHGGGGGGRKRG
eukprot:6192950-Pleurochrysis_carterae.AAC.3